MMTSLLIGFSLSIRSAVCGLQSAVCSLQSAVCSLQMSYTDSYQSCTKGTSTTLLEQCHAGERNSKPSLTSFLTSTQHYNSHPILLTRNYPSWTSTYAFLMIRLKPLSSTRKLILTTTSISLLFILTTASVLSLTASSSACVDFAPTTMTFLVKSRDMTIFFTQRAYPCTSLEHDLRRVTTIRRSDALSESKRDERTVDRVSVVLTYHPF